MLCYYLYCKMILFNINIGIVTHSLHQTSLYFGSGVISMMQYSELRMPSLTVKVESAIFILVEINTPINQLSYLLRSIAYHHFHRSTV